MLRAEAGLALADLVWLLLPRRLFPPVVPGTQFVTLGGMVAADVHGKNHHVDGTFGRHGEARAGDDVDARGRQRGVAVGAAEAARQHRAARHRGEVFAQELAARNRRSAPARQARRVVSRRHAATTISDAARERKREGRRRPSPVREARAPRIAQKLTRSPSRACQRDRVSEVENGLDGSVIALVKFWL
ncbi:MAG TPA: hypothetical protein VGC00_07775 [Thermoanaerobaculia bacterium]